MSKIAFFDSGVGGITVLQEAIKMLPHENYIYYGDNLHAPYGTKSKEEVKQYIFDAVKFITTLNIKALVIACNTATSVAAEELRKQYSFPIVGMEPAVKPALEKHINTGKKVLILATALTLKEEKLQNLIIKMQSQSIVDFLALPELVLFAENLEFDEKIIRAYLQQALVAHDLNAYGAVVLGCTHYVFYKNVFEKILPTGVDVFDGNLATIKHLRDVLEQRNLLRDDANHEVDFYYSGIKPKVISFL